MESHRLQDRATLLDITYIQDSPVPHLDQNAISHKNETPSSMLTPFPPLALLTPQASSMAELSLAIVGAIAAWKSIVEFGELITKLTDDDARRREGMWLRLEVSQYRLKDWGHDWGVDRVDGRFHHFESARKDLIMKIIFRLRDSRQKALERLQNRYGLSSNQNNQEMVAAKDSLPSLITTVKSASKRVRDKSIWLAHDRDTISDLVSETVELHEHLQYLTYGSAAFILKSFPIVQSAPSLKEGLQHLEHSGRQSAQHFQQSLTSPPNSPTCNMDEQTLASYAIKTIASSRQARRIHEHIDRAFHYHGDSRIPEIISDWWNDERSRLLVLETPDIADDHTAAFTCSLLYYLTSCHRLAYTFQEDSAMRPEQEFFQMLKTFILSMAPLQGDQIPQMTPFPLVVADIESMPMEDRTSQQLTELFNEMLLDLLSRSRMRILVIIYGLEVCEGEKNKRHIFHLRSFFRNLQKICSQTHDGREATAKIVLGYKGHAMTLYDCVEPESIADVTSHPTGSTSLMQELALKLNHDTEN